ncbi:MAG: putative metal-binding motif-containing protein [Deltaproteobacteria bacterium]|nr:putative metal-binding motif-containing protein [Deltaproteobacteria bacterium]MBW2534382.1 putative metal-binding motif-containing protein [Deltaproteobacteria bacterium]
MRRLTVLGATVGLSLVAHPVASHPTLLFGVEDEPALMAKVQQGVPQQVYEQMQINCWIGFPPYDFGEPGAFSWCKCLEEQSFLYRMSGDSIYLDFAAGALANMVATTPSELPVAANPEWYLAVPVAVAVGYDLLFAELSVAERQAVIDWLEAYAAGIWSYLADGSSPPVGHRPIEAYGALGFVGLAIAGESSHPDVAAWIDTAAQQLSEVALLDGYNSAGSFDGGYPFSTFVAPVVLRFAEAYRRARGVDLLTGTHIEAAPRWYTYGLLPHGQYPSCGASNYQGGVPFTAEHLLLIGRAHDSLAKWGWHQANDRYLPTLASGPLPLSDRLAVALWYPDATPTIDDPASYGHPFDQHFPDTANPTDGHVGFDAGRGGMTVLRSGWSTDSVALVVRASDEWTEHSHNDSSSFILSAFGAEMASDYAAVSGYDRRSDHNVVIVGAHDDGASERTSYGGALERMVSTALAGYVRVDSRFPAGEHAPGDPVDLTDDVWTPVDRAERILALVRGPRPYVIVADDVQDDQADGPPSEWRLRLGSSAGWAGGSGRIYDPARFYFSTTTGAQSQLVVTTVEPEEPAAAWVNQSSYVPWNWRVSVTAPTVPQARFLAILQPIQLVPEDPGEALVTRFAMAGGVGAQLSWSDGWDQVLWRYGASPLDGGSTYSDARLLIVRYDSSSAPWAWTALEATRIVEQGQALLDSGGLEVSVSSQAGTLEVFADETPAPRQIAVFGPSVTRAELDGEPVRFVRSGSYVYLPAACADAERCNGIDDDCDDLVDEDDAEDAPTWYRDYDDDGYGDGADAQRSCHQPLGYSPHGTDCDDGDDDVHPAAGESCSNGVDDDCDGAVDLSDSDCADQGMMMGTTGGCNCTTPGHRRPPSPNGTALALWLAALLFSRRRQP